MKKFQNICFFCDKEITDKKTKEHVIPNSLLGKLGIKEDEVSGERTTQYSRLKVPAHSSCNNEFGSEYEEMILEFLKDPNELYNSLIDEEYGLPVEYAPSFGPTAIFTTWLSKIYYGLFYDDYLKTNNKDWKQLCKSIITSKNFEYVKKSYKNGYGFQLPSSLFVFKTNNNYFDLLTNIEPETIMIKINSITLVLCISDGYLTKNYLDLESLRNSIEIEDKKNIDFPSQRLAFAEILALRSCIPKSPSFLSDGKRVTNMSFSSMVPNPAEYYQINDAEYKKARLGYLNEFKIN